MSRNLTRRSVVACTCALTAAAALPGCAAYGSAGPAVAPAPDPLPAKAAVAPAALAATADIPVGGGVVFADRRIVVTQPTAGAFAAFDTTCTHQGCAVTEVAGGTINCPCHGSKFRIADVNVANGPAKKPLAQRKLTVQDGRINVA